jgi:three-Cys-motif partner protein
MSGSDFFRESMEQSLIKITIVSKYFGVWARIMLRNLKKYGGDKIAYIDLFCGPGRYDDGTPSTPLLILEQAIQNEELRCRLVTWFVDEIPKYVDTLKDEIRKLPGIQRLAHQPFVANATTGDEIASFFENRRNIPTLLFLDPWGYKGITLRLIKSILKDWGCDCIIFFNYNRINPGLDNPAVKRRMDSMFGETRATQLRHELQGLQPNERELTIVNEFGTALRDAGGNFVLPFCFKQANGKRTSHYLVFVTKHVLGYLKMKETMAKCGSETEQGVPTFQYAPASARQQMLFEYSRPLDDLEMILLDDFSGQTIQMKEIFERHHVGTPYIEPNYKEALTKLEERKAISTDPPVERRQKRQGKPTFGSTVLVTFPSK